MLEKPTITLTTDFGLKDPFVGIMKGVILGINPKAQIIDLSHNISRHNVFEASQVISMSCGYFPPKTIHVVVVDPDVGGRRRPLLIVTGDYYFIGPDNGIFTPVFEKQQSNVFTVVHLSSSHYFLPMSGSTFHGRDIFAPVAAWLSKGVDSSRLGEQIMDYRTITVPTPALVNNNTFEGEIISIDIFGNAITNIKRDDLTRLNIVASKDQFMVIFRDKQLPVADYYADPCVPGTTLSVIINSFGHLELFVCRDSAAGKFGIKIGDSVSVLLTTRG